MGVSHSWGCWEVSLWKDVIATVQVIPVFYYLFIWVTRFAEFGTQADSKLEDYHTMRQRCDPQPVHQVRLTCHYISIFTKSIQEDTTMLKVSMSSSTNTVHGEPVEAHSSLPVEKFPGLPDKITQFWELLSKEQLYEPQKMSPMMNSKSSGPSWRFGKH